MKKTVSIFVIFCLSFQYFNCSKKKKGIFPIWMAGLSGSSDSGTVRQGTDSNGVKLPESNPTSASTSTSTSTAVTGVTSTSTSSTVSASSQENATAGSAKITGQIIPQVGSSNICLSSNNPPGCIADPSGTSVDLTAITVKLVQNVNGVEQVVATTYLDANGNYSFNVPNLSNGTYRILTNSGNGLNYAYQDFNFTYDPTSSSSSTQVSLGPIAAERMYFSSGAAKISGNVSTPGFNGDVIIPAGSLSGVPVILKDSKGVEIARATTDSSGNYYFCFNTDASACPKNSTNVSNYLANGNYTVSYLGSSITSNSRNFSDVNQALTFSFSGTNQSVFTNTAMSNVNLSWNAATSSFASVSIKVANAALTDTTTNYSIKLKAPDGSIVTTGSLTGAGNLTLSGANMSAGVYVIEISSPNSATTYQSFNFIPHSTGATKTIDLTSSAISVLPIPSKVNGVIKSGAINPVPGAVINFKPDSTVKPSELSYLLQGFSGMDLSSLSSEKAQYLRDNQDRLKSLAALWMSEACAAYAACNTACSAGGYSSTCIISNQGSGPWTYSSYQNKVYDVNGTDLSMIAIPGKWKYYISAPGYENFVNSPDTITLNGNDLTIPDISLTSTTKRSLIDGTVVVKDKISGASAYTDYSSVTGLFAVMLGNSTTSGTPVAHITTTSAGAFNFNGSSKVVSLNGFNSDLDGNGIVDDADRVRYAIGAYSSATALSATSSVAGATSADSVQQSGGEYYFKQSSYQVIIADPLGHIVSTPKQADNSGVASGTLTTAAKLTLSNIAVLHQTRYSVSGTVTDAISTAAISGATVQIGKMVNGTFTVVKRDCSTGEASSSTVCSMPSTRTTGSDQDIPSVTTDATGKYNIYNLDAGSYTIKITNNGIDSYVPVTIGSTYANSSNAVTANAQVITTTGRGKLVGSVKTTGTGGTLSSFTGAYTLELVNPTFGTRPTTGVQPISLVTGATSFSNTPDYTIMGIDAGTWKVKFTATNYTNVEAIVNIQANGTTNLDIVTFVPSSSANAAVSGVIRSAMTNLPISGGLTVRLRSGLNAQTGDYVANIPSITIGTDGTYAIPNVPPGNYTLEISGTGYMTTYRTVVSSGANTPPNQDVLISPTLGADEIRIVLSWGASPRDVDSHLEFGNSTCLVDGKKCQVVYNDKNKLGGDLTLDIDDVDGYGPETVTVKGSSYSQSRLGYILYNYTNESSLSVSQSIVRVFKSTGLVRTYAVSANQVDRWWPIFCITSTKSIVDVGQTGCEVSTFFKAVSN